MDVLVDPFVDPLVVPPPDGIDEFDEAVATMAHEDDMICLSFVVFVRVLFLMCMYLLCIGGLK